MNKTFRKYMAIELSGSDIQTVEDFRELICYYRVWEIDLFLAKASKLVIKKKLTRKLTRKPREQLKYKK